MPIPRGKVPAPPPKIASIRAITREDLPRLRQPRDKAVSFPGRLRQSHHRVAELLAMGFGLSQVALLTGYSYNRVATLSTAPAMRELIAIKTATREEMQTIVEDSFREIHGANMLAAARHINDRIAELDEEGELLPIRDALNIVSDGADRFGYGKHTTQTNFNVDFAAKLEAAIARSKSPPQIEGRANPPNPSPAPQSAAGPEPSSRQTAPPQTLRRIA